MTTETWIGVGLLVFLVAVPIVALVYHDHRQYKRDIRTADRIDQMRRQDAELGDYYEWRKTNKPI